MLTASENPTFDDAKPILRKDGKDQGKAKVELSVIQNLAKWLIEKADEKTQAIY